MQLYPDSLLEKLGYEQVRGAMLAQTQSVRTRELISELHPTSHAETVRRLLQETAEMTAILRNPDTLALSDLPDVRPYLAQSKAAGSIIPLHAFSEILKLTKTARIVKNFLKPAAEDNSRLSAYADELIPLRELEKQIEHVVTETGELKDNASAELKAIRTRLNRKKSDIRITMNRLMQRIAKDGMASEEGITLRNGRMVLPVLAEFKRKIQGFVHDVSATGQTVYMEPVEALQLNNEIRQIEAEEQREIERILRELTGLIRTNRELIAHNLEILAQLETIKAKAALSIRLNAEIPIISANRHLKLKNAFNANLLLRNLHLPKDKRAEIIPLFLELASNEQCLIITGPNAGGKSVAMKTVGIFVLMIQSGIAIPADATSEMPIFSGLYVDMGDDQSIENDLSTFSSRLNWMQQTTQYLTDNALVLIDEAAAGTDPEEGGALFQAFIEFLLEKHCKIIATTHHGSLKVFAHEHPLAVNGSMEFDQTHLTPTYRFKKGVPGSSYAFEIAGRMNIHKKILERSTTLLGDSKNKLESLIVELENKTQQTNELKKSLEKLMAQAAADHLKYQQQLEALNKEKDKIKEKALLEAKAIMDNANKRIETAVEEISLRKETDDARIKELRTEIQKEKAAIHSSLYKIKERREKRSAGHSIPPVAGDYVRFLDGSTTGELVEIKGKQAVVQADGLRLVTKYQNLIKSEPPKKKETKAHVLTLLGDESLLNETVKPALDVRGFRTEDAITEVMYYLDRAVFRGLQQVEIIHGIGDGILKSQIHKYLDERNDIRDFKAANEDQGGPGRTLIRIK